MKGNVVLGEVVVEAPFLDDEVGGEDDGGVGGGEGGAEIEAGQGALPLILVRGGGVDDGLLGQEEASGSRSRRRRGLGEERLDELGDALDFVGVGLRRVKDELE